MRGNNRAHIFNSDEDRTTLLKVIGSVKRRYGWKVHAYCLMTNHYHLLTETPEPNIGAGMQWMNSTYAHRFNEKYDRIGHLFQRRYADGIILTDEHLREVIRYIPLNPVRAGLCKRPEDWPWSSCRAILGSGSREPFLSVRPTLDRFSSDRDVARTLLREWIEEGRHPPWTACDSRHLASGSIERIFAGRDRDPPWRQQDHSLASGCRVRVTEVQRA